MKNRRVAFAAGFAALLAMLPMAPAARAQPPKDPVVIVAGTTMQQSLANIYYAVLAQRLAADGYNVSIFGLPEPPDISAKAAVLAAYVDQVLAQTGASKVDLIGNSQGGLSSRYYIKNLGGASKVDALVSVSVPHYGDTLSEPLTLDGAWDCLGFCAQTTAGSAFLNELNAGDDTPGDVQYTNLVTEYQVFFRPVSQGFLTGENSTNVRIQDQCPLRVVDHFGMVLDGTVYSGVQDALAGRPITLDCWKL